MVMCRIQPPPRIWLPEFNRSLGSEAWCEQALIGASQNPSPLTPIKPTNDAGLGGQLGDCWPIFGPILRLRTPVTPVTPVHFTRP